jgi:hypothetical protein
MIHARPRSRQRAFARDTTRQSRDLD